MLETINIKIQLDKQFYFSEFAANGIFKKRCQLCGELQRGEIESLKKIESL